jgi:hypothetical protein
MLSLPAFLASTDGSIVIDSVSLHTFTEHSFEEFQDVATDRLSRKHSWQHSWLPLPTFLASSDGSMASDSVSLLTFTQHSFEELQGLLSLAAFLASADGRPVSDGASLHIACVFHKR